MFPLADTFLMMDHGTFLHIMLAVAITLLVLDVFVCTEVLSFISLIVFAAWGTWLVGAPWQWSVLVFIGFLVLACVLYYTLWVQCVRRLVMDCILKKAPKESVEQAGGQILTVIGEGENLCVRWDDLVIPVETGDKAGLQPGDQVELLAVRGGLAHVRKK